MLRYSFGLCFYFILTVPFFGLCVLGQEDNEANLDFYKVCGDNEFDCEHISLAFPEKCIPKNLVCDGKRHCSFANDETSENCGNKTCTASEFHCAYGGCVPLSVVCDKKDDCIDGSDESSCDRFNKKNNCKFQSDIPCLTTPDGKCISPYEKCDGAVDCGDNSDEIFSTCHNIRCPDYLFQCNYGACIDLELVCNGKADCIDNSDELQPRCGNTLIAQSAVCGLEKFKCQSNLCIDKHQVCDGIRDCDDGSDETYKQCSGQKCNPSDRTCRYGACATNRTCYECADSKITCDSPAPSSGGGGRPGSSEIQTTPIPIRYCRYPYQPKNGSYITPTGTSFQAGNKAAKWTILQFSCDEGFKLDGEPIIICMGDEWNHQPPLCLEKCPPLFSSNHEIECSLNNKPISCDDAYEGTIANIKCKDAFEIGDFLYQPYNGIKCQDGAWNNVLFDCNPKCGTTPKATPLVIKGYKAKKNEFPWHVGIYHKDGENDNDFEQICGGTLISEKVVLSAAHCFWNWQNPKELVTVYNYAIAVGKYYRKWNQTQDHYAQYSGVKQIILPKKFQAEQSSYAHDLAVLILNKTIEFSVSVKPICLDRSNKLYLKLLKPGSFGTVAGWGLTEEFGGASEELQAVNMPYVPYEQCFNSSPVDFRPFITDDKICAGYENGTSVCTGDSGGGLTFKKSDRYFLEGVVSVSPAKGQSCDSHHYVAFTSIPNHMPWIMEVESEIN